MRRNVHFVLAGEIPSKKNSWKPRKGGGMYIPENVQSKLEDFFYQLVSIRNKKRISEPFTGRLKTEFYFTLGSNPEHVDIDNMETTLLDLLQKTRIIENDKFVFETRNIKQHVVDMEKPCISVDITELE